jgi:UDP-N-acetylmuramate--alanine ligase
MKYKLRSEIRTVHFVGIGGSGMSAIAKVLLEKGYRVSGSDVTTTDTTEKLEKMGATVYQGHHANNVKGVDAVVVSSAIAETNAELLAAHDLKIPIYHRADMIALLMEKQKGIAVAGAHGKTTTTSMIALMLEKLGTDPTIIIGGELHDIGGNAKLGSGEYLVAEADESDGSFLKLAPQIAVVTNIENDHMDFYGTIENIVDAFKQFLQQLTEGSLAVLCADSDYVRMLAAERDKPFVTYALNHAADYTIKNIRTQRMQSLFDVYYQGEPLGEMELNVPGEHNIANSLAAIAVGRYMGFTLKQIRGAMQCFSGAKRRFQTKGEIEGIWVVDDYAHHPTEIKSTLMAAQQTKPGRLIAVFQPHRYTRTKFLREEFGKAFSCADVIILTDIYAAGEQPIDGINGALLAQEVEKQEGRPVVYIKGREDIPDYLYSIAQAGDLIITMGAGNIWQAGERLVEKLRARS